MRSKTTCTFSPPDSNKRQSPRWKSEVSSQGGSSNELRVLSRTSWSRTLRLRMSHLWTWSWHRKSKLKAAPTSTLVRWATALTSSARFKKVLKSLCSCRKRWTQPAQLTYRRTHTSQRMCLHNPCGSWISNNRTGKVKKHWLVEVRQNRYFLLKKSAVQTTPRRARRRRTEKS